MSRGGRLPAPGGGRTRKERAGPPPGSPRWSHAKRVWRWSCVVGWLLCAACASVPPPTARGPVAVWDLEGLSAGNAENDWGEILAGKVAETLQARDYPVVERERLVAVLEELSLGSGALADESTRLKVGRLSGASLMVFGGYQVFGAQARVDVRLVDVETGKVVRAAQSSGPADVSSVIQASGEAAAALASPR